MRQLFLRIRFLWIKLLVGKRSYVFNCHIIPSEKADSTSLYHVAIHNCAIAGVYVGDVSKKRPEEL